MKTYLKGALVRIVRPMGARAVHVTSGASSQIWLNENEICFVLEHAAENEWVKVLSSCGIVWTGGFNLSEIT